VLLHDGTSEPCVMCEFRPRALPCGRTLPNGKAAASWTIGNLVSRTLYRQPLLVLRTPPLVGRIAPLVWPD